METLIQDLKEGVAAGASDWHWTTDAPAWRRAYGKLAPEALTTSRAVLDAFQRHVLPHVSLTAEYIDDAFVLDGETFRFHAYKTGGNQTVAIRHVRQQAYTLEEIGIPPGFKKLLTKQDGLILVTGPTGSGKSTSLVSAIDFLNTTDDLHIITLEDPVEFRHTSKRSLVHQREFGKDFKSFAEAIKYAMREDPDVIMVGEMRDYETIAAALTAAETGHLVFGTLHTGTAGGAISRLLDAAKDHEPELIASQLASKLLGVLAQRLPKTVDGKRCGAYELLVQTLAVSNLIRTGNTKDLPDEIAKGTIHGMVSMDDSLHSLFLKRRISREIALQFATRPDQLLTKSGFR